MRWTLLLLSPVLILGAVVIVSSLFRPSPWRPWTCPRCRRRHKGEDTRWVIFCPDCGTPRPMGDGLRHPLQFGIGKNRWRKWHHPPPRGEVTRQARARVNEILVAERVEDALPLGAHSTAYTIDPVPDGVTLSEAYTPWQPVWTPENVKNEHGLPPFPQRAPDTVVPPNLYKVAIDCVDPSRPPDERHTQAGYEGLLVNLLVSIDEGKIWDARAERAW